MPEPGWVRDPSGRYHQRFFDGTKWTDHVADEYGRRGVDPVEAIQRSGPSISAGPPVTGGLPAVATAPPARATSTAMSLSSPPAGISVATVVAGIGMAVLAVSLIFLPWLGDARLTESALGLAASGAGVWESSYFEAGWIVTLLAGAVVTYALATSAATRRARPWLAAIVALCTVWAIVGTVMLRSSAGDSGLGTPSFEYGFFAGVVGMIAVTVAPLLSDRRFGTP